MRGIVLVLIPLYLLLAACSNPTPTPTPLPTATPTPVPTPTPTPSFEQKRSDVLRYIRDFNTIRNSLDDTASQIQLPEDTSTASGLLAFNAAVGKFITAMEGAIRRMAELRPSPLDPDTSAHLQKARTFLENGRQLLEDLKQAVAAGDSNRIAQQLNRIDATSAEASSVNRTTEQLLLKYNISDSEVNYRFRGE